MDLQKWTTKQSSDFSYVLIVTEIDDETIAYYPTNRKTQSEVVNLCSQICKTRNTILNLIK